MKKALLLSLALIVSSCREDDNQLLQNQTNLEKTITKNSASRIYEASKPSLSYGEYEFLRNENGRIAVFKNQEWLYDLELSDYNCSTEGNLENSNLIFTHSNGIDQYKTLNFRLNNDVALLDFETSIGVSVKDIKINNYSSFKTAPWGIIVEVVLTVYEWLTSHTTTTEGGTRGDCSAALSNCINGGFMTYTVTTGWFGIQTGSTCSVTCY